MTRIALTGGDYRARSLIASAQRCVNLIPEQVPQVQGEAAQYMYHPTPGLGSFIQGADFTITDQPVRCLYTMTTGAVVWVIGNTLWYGEISRGEFTTLKVIDHLNSFETALTRIYMQDNGIVLIVVDGSGVGYAIPLSQIAEVLPLPNEIIGSNPISDPAFYGSNCVAYLDTFFLFNQPGTQNFYVSPSNYDGNARGNDPFDGTYIAAKTTYPDNLVTVQVAGQQIYLIGEQTAEIWYNAGTPDFPFGRVPSLFLNHGCSASQSPATGDGSCYWLGNDKLGRAIVWQATGYSIQRVSTHAIEGIISDNGTGTSVISDAIGYCYQSNGHSFYVLNFPTLDITLVYDATTQLWHERTFTAPDGSQHRHRVNCVASNFGYILAGDWGNGQIYQFNDTIYTDGFHLNTQNLPVQGNPITRTRSFPHMLDDWNRIIYRRFTIDMQVGSPPPPGYAQTADAQVSVSWSDDRGATFGQPVLIDIGSSGETTISPTVWRLGIARDRVFQVSWTAPVFTALLGAFVEIQECAS